MRRMISTLRAGVAGFAAVMLVAGTAQAADPLVAEKNVPGKFSGTVSLTSEYLFRGISQTDDAPAIQGSLDYEAKLGDSGVSGYLGIWGSNVRFKEGSGVDGATIEADFYGGLRGSIGKTGIGWDVGFIYYAYPGADSNLNYDYVEAQGAVSYDFGPAAATFSLNYSPDNFGESGDAFYTKLGVDVPVGKFLTLSAYGARQTIDKEQVFGAPDYWEWNFSGSVNVAGFDLSVAYSDTDIPNADDKAGPTVIFTVARSF